MTTWVNPDGQTVRYGTDQAKVAAVGEPKAYGPVKTIVAVLNATDLVLAGGVLGGTGMANDAIPLGSVILRANLIVTTAFTSAGAPTLDIGLANADGTYTNLSETGIFSAVALATLALGSVIAGTGALVGAGTSRQTLANGYLSYDVDTALYTAGKALLVIEYVPLMY